MDLIFVVVPRIIITRTKNVLNKGQEIKFQESCFKNFYNITHFRFNEQLIHSMLLRKC